MQEIEEIKLDIDYHKKQLDTLTELIPRLQNDKYNSEQMLIVLENRLKLAESKPNTNLSERFNSVI